MLEYTAKNFSLAINATIEGHIQNQPITAIHTDSRTAHFEEQSVFFAIKGVLHDGHSFIPDVYLKGCRFFVIERLSAEVLQYKNDATFFLVNNSLEALQRLASDYRKKFSPETVAITGSNGKTITKEWLHYILSKEYSAFRSPKSYNSQIGVPLSVLMFREAYEIAILEAGISEMGEMEKLEKIIKPETGIFTNLGDAHQENFASMLIKLEEKLQLFKDCKLIIYNTDNRFVAETIHDKFSGSKELFSWGATASADIQVNYKKEQIHTKIQYQYKNTKGEIQIPFTDNASCFNACSILAYLIASGKMEKHATVFNEQFSNLPAVEMRLEQSEGINGCSIINDSFNADIESVHIALEFLARQSAYKNKTLIISDLFQFGAMKDEVYKKLASVITTSGIRRIFAIGTDIGKYLKENELPVTCFTSTKEFISSFSPNDFNNEAILLKGARKFTFEKIASLLVSKTHRTVLEIKLPALKNNLLYFRKKLKPETKIMAMVKAFSYGSGSGEIAHFLEHCKLDYLAVAFVDEGVELRKKGIETPIMVLGPSEQEFYTMLSYKLEPEIYSFDSLYAFDRFLANQKQSSPYPIHLKFDTGMHRVGFKPEEWTEVCRFIKSSNSCIPASVFSHLAGADSSEFDDYTLLQLHSFEKLSSNIKAEFPDITRHILNSAGIERFTQYQFDMVRLGIGLYGISSAGSNELEHISTLKTKITQIKHLKAGDSVGYSRKGRLSEDSTIATVPIGYADGYSRFFSNGKGKMIVNGIKASVIGNVCMDACMLNITGIEAEVGEEVTVFGEDLTISELADSIGTIPYEILTSISSRVKRVYIEQ